MLVASLHRAVVLVVWSLIIEGGAFANNLYAYTDAAGVLHLSTTPHHDKFKRISSLNAPDRAEPKSVEKMIPANTFTPLIKNAAQQYQVDEALLHAVIKTESAYNSRALSRKGAIGLMQLMPATARHYGVTNAYDPEENIQGGTRYLKDLMGKFNNNLSLVLAAYNAGEMAVVRHGHRVPPFRETLNYIPTVLKHYQAYSGCPAPQCNEEN